jgi:hypothetical protein
MNIEELQKYKDVFNARKLVIVRVGEDIHPPEVVEREFDLPGVEFIRLPNDKKLGEVSGFIEVLSRLKSYDPEEITFYAHTKGVSHRDESAKHMDEIRHWRNTMYTKCLDGVGRAEYILAKPKYACCGCFKQERGVLRSAWHFAGTFWWVKHSSLFRIKRHTQIIKDRYGVEGYLGNIFVAKEAYCLHSGNMLQ